MNNDIKENPSADLVKRVVRAIERGARLFGDIQNHLGLDDQGLIERALQQARNERLIQYVKGIGWMLTKP